MVSDTLVEAIREIDGYLAQPSLYQGETREMVMKLLRHMEEVRFILDKPPGTEREIAVRNNA